MLLPELATIYDPPADRNSIWAIGRKPTSSTGQELNDRHACGTGTEKRTNLGKPPQTSVESKQSLPYGRLCFVFAVIHLLREEHSSVGRPSSGSAAGVEADNHPDWRLDRGSFGRSARATVDTTSPGESGAGQSESCDLAEVEPKSTGGTLAQRSWRRRAGGCQQR